MLLPIPLFALALLVQAPVRQSSGVELEALVRRVQAAVESGRDSAERAHWTTRLATESESARLALATLDRLTYRYPAATRNYEALAAEGATTQPVRAYAMLGLAMLHVQKARFADAEPVLRRAATTIEGPDGAAARAQALMYLAIVFARTVSIDSALATYRVAERTVPAGDEWLRSLIRCNTLVARVRAADPAAPALARPASRAAIRAGNPRAAAACLAALAQDQERRTAGDSAMATFDEVASLQRGTRNLAALAVTRQWQGYVLSVRGDYAAARPALDEAVALGRRTETLAASAYAELSLADLALSFGDLVSAGRYARSASVAFATMGDRSGMVLVRMHEGDVALLNRSLPAARAAFEQVIRESAALFPSVAVHAHGRLAAVALFEGDWLESERVLDVARVSASRLNMPEWRQEDGYGRAMLALTRGRLDEAVDLLNKLDSVIPPNNPGVRADVLTRLAEAHVRAGRVAEAEVELARAGDLVNEWRGTLPGRDVQAAVIEARTLDWDRDLGFATTISGLVAAGRIGVAFRSTEQRRARLLLEALTRRQALAGRLDGVAHSMAILAEAEARRILPESTAVLAFVTGGGREPTTVFVITRERIMAVGAAPVDDHANELARFIGLLAAGVEPTELAQRLGDAFLRAPLALVPPHVRRLVIVPDGPLHRVPFDALVVVDSRLLVERYAVSIAPSVAVAATWWATVPRAPRPRLLAFGDPVGVRLIGAAGDSAPPRLPAAAREARQIARFASSAEVLTGVEAREARMRRGSLRDFGVLHFATHAEVEEWSLLRSALLLSPGDGEDGRLTADELLGLRLDANVVVLSACRSGSGAVLAGEGLQGLTIPFLEAGASAVVATLWQVGDQSAAPMIELFYRELAAGRTVGDALHQAKLAARERGISAATWAAFNVTGDERVTTALRHPRPHVVTYLLPAGMLVLGVGYLAARTMRRRNGERR